MRVSELVPDCPICRGKGAGIAAPRHVASWAVLTAAEQFGLLAKLGEALGSGATGIRLVTQHGHLVLRPIHGADTPARLTTGAEDPLLPLIAQGIDGADSVDLAVAFAMESGVQLVEPWFRDLLARGGRLRVVVGDYMDVTEPAALWRLADLEGADLRVFETGTGSFHPKAWLFRATSRQGAAIIGSSNLSRTALTTGVEWNLHAEGAADLVAAAFDALLAHPQVRHAPAPRAAENMFLAKSKTIMVFQGLLVPQLCTFSRIQRYFPTYAV